MRRAFVVRDALGPLASVVSVFTGSGFNRPVEVESVSRLFELLQSDGADLVVVAFDQLSAAQLDDLERILQERPGLAAIATAPTADSALILAAFRKGLAEFLVSPTDPRELSSALARLESRWARAPRGGHITAVYSPAGGAGVTTVAVNVAHALSLRKPPGRVAVADLVVGLGDVATQLNITPIFSG